METTVAKKSGRKTKKIPEYLIYEMDEGKPNLLPGVQGVFTRPTSTGRNHK